MWFDTSDIPDLSTLGVKAKASKTLHNLAPVKAIKHNFSAYDINHDGQIDASDCPYDLGSPDAKLWWENVVVPYTKATQSLPEAMHYQNLYPGKFMGFYHGKPMVRDTYVTGDGDLDYITDRLMVTQGISKAAAQNVAEYIRANLYRGTP